MGIDPHCQMIPKYLEMLPPKLAARKLSTLLAILSAPVFKRHRQVVAIKPQSAFLNSMGRTGCAFKRLGKPLLMQEYLPLDAKRGDIDSTSTAYANAWIGHDAAFPSDALTVNPWLASIRLIHFSPVNATSSGLFVLNRTSNRGWDFARPVSSVPLYTHLASMLAPLAAALLVIAVYPRLASWLGPPGQIQKPVIFCPF